MTKSTTVKKLVSFLICVAILASLAIPSTAKGTGKKVFGKDWIFKSNNSFDLTGDSIPSSDVHSGWGIGEFTLEGFSGTEIGDGIFLKNADDEIKLTFKLNQNINKLCGKEDLKIAYDSATSFSAFNYNGTEQFGRGALLIMSENYKGETNTVFHRNFLESECASGSTTTIGIYEEGDYVVALLYEIEEKNGHIIKDAYTQYTLCFYFSIRNGNCRVFPRDIDQPSRELKNSDMVKRGFFVDVAESKYLHIQVIRDEVRVNGNKITFNTKFNKEFSDKEEFTDEGLYTVIAYNDYTGGYDAKYIYVGDDIVLSNGKSLSAADLLLIYNGATIDDSGNIDLSNVEMNDEVYEAIKEDIKYEIRDELDETKLTIKDELGKALDSELKSEVEDAKEGLSKEFEKKIEIEVREAKEELRAELRDELKTTIEEDLRKELTPKIKKGVEDDLIVPMVIFIVISTLINCVLVVVVVLSLPKKNKK